MLDHLVAHPEKGLLAYEIGIRVAKEVSEVSVCGAAGECATYDGSDFKSLMFRAEDAGPADPPASRERDGNFAWVALNPAGGEGAGASAPARSHPDGSPLRSCWAR